MGRRRKKPSSSSRGEAETCQERGGEEWVSSLRRRPLLAVLLAVALVYLNGLWGGFVWDDHYLIVTNGSIASLDLALMFSSDFFADAGQRPENKIGYYRPLTTLTYRLEYRIWGKSPAGYHLTNLLLHLAVTALVFPVVRRCGGGRLLAAVAAALFGLHPVNAGAVDWIAGRTDSLAALFSLLALLAWLSFLRSEGAARRVVPVTMAFTAALLCKEAAAALILVFALTALTGTPSGPRRPRGQVLAALALQAAALTGYLYLRVSVAGVTSSQTAYHGGSPWSTFLMMGKVFLRYLTTLLLPGRLVHEYGEKAFAVASPTDGGALASWALVLCALGVAVWYARRRGGPAWWGLIFFLAALAPVSQVLPFYPIAAERFLYLPSMGLALVGASLFVTEKDGGERLRMAPVLAVILVLYGLASFRETFVWRSDLRFWERTAALSPRSSTAWNYLGVARLLAGDTKGAIPCFERALALAPSWPAASNLIEALIASGRNDEAARALRRWKARWPTKGIFHDHAGQLAVFGGRFEEAIGHFRTAVALDPSREEPLQLLGACYLKLGRFREAYDTLIRAAALRAAPVTLMNLAEAARRLGRPNEELRHLVAAARAPEAPALAFLRLAQAYGQRRRPVQALRAAEDGVRAHPMDPNLSRLLDSLRRQRRKGS